MAMRYFNWKLAIVLLVATVVCAVGAFSLHRWRRSSMAEQALARGEQAFEERRWDDAVDDLGRYLMVNGKDVPVLRKHAEAQIRRRPQSPLNVYRAIQMYRTVLLLEPDDLDTAKTLTRLYVDGGAYGEAAPIAQRFLERQDDPALRCTYAEALWNLREFDKAMAEVTKVVEQHPSEIAAYAMASAWADQKRASTSGKSRGMWLDEAVLKNPDAALAYVVRAAYRREQGDKEGTAADLTRALGCDLSDPRIRLRLAMELAEAEMWDEARAQLKILRAADPTNVGLWRTWAGVADRTRSLEEMYTVAEEGMKALGADMWDFMPAATRLLIRSGHLEKVPGYLSQMRDRDLDPIEVAFLDGLLAAQQNDTRGAVDAWRRAVSLQWRYPRQERTQIDAYLALADALRQLGETQSAIGQLQTLLSKYPTHAEGSLRLARLLAENRSGNWQRVAAQAAHAQQYAKEDPNTVARAARLELQARIQDLILSGSADTDAARATWDDIEAKVNELDPGSVEVSLLRVQIATYRKRFTEAAALLTELESQHPNDMRVMLLHAEYCAAGNQDAEARTRFRNTVAAFPDEYLPVRGFAIFLNRRGQKQECETLVREAFVRVREPQTRRALGMLMTDFYNLWKEDDKRYRWLMEMTAQFPTDLQFKRWLLACDTVMADSRRSQRIIDEIKAIEGPTGSQWRYEQAKFWANSEEFRNAAGRDASQRGETSLYAQIVKLLQENLLGNADDHASRLLLAEVYGFAGEQQLALTAYRETYDRAPNHTQVVERYVRALLAAGEFKTAQAILDKLSDRLRQDPAILRLMAASDVGRGQLVAASDTLRQLIEQEPNDVTLQLYQAHVLTLRKEYAQAEAILSDVWAKRSDSILVAFALMQIHVQQNNADKAMTLCNEAIERFRNAAAYMLRADAYMRLNQPDKAMTDLGQAIALEPENPDGWEARAGVHRALGRLPDAISDVRRALTLAPGRPRIQRLAAELFLSSGSGALVQEAENLLTKAIADPKNRDPGVVLLMARYRARQGARSGPALAEARNLLRQLTEEHPRNVEAWATMGELELNQGQPSRALEIATRGLVHNGESKQLLLLKGLAEKAVSPGVAATTTLHQLVQQYPEDLDILLHWADACIKADRAGQAVKELSQKLDGFTGDSRFRCRIALARALYSDGQRDTANELFDTLVAAEPNNPAPVMTRCQLLRQEKRWTEVNQLLNQWRTTNPQDARTATDMAHILAGSGDPQALMMAEDQLRMILDSNPDAVPTLVLLSMLMQDAGRNEETTRLNRRILELDPNNVIAINNLTWVMCETGSPSSATLREALELANRGLAVLPDYADLLDTRGMVYYRLGEFAKAVADFTQCISLFPVDASLSAAPRFHLARAYAGMHHRVEAVERLKEAMNLNRRNIRLARDHAATGRTTHAIKILKDAITLQEDMDQFKLGFDLQDSTVNRYAADWVDARLYLEQLQKGR